MTLTAGTRLGPYEISEPLGAGGMGEVYRARDTKLGRDVALKTLPDAFARDHERVARFRREAQVLAALNHPHIAAIHGFEDVDGTSFLVLEFVDGETLAERLKQGPLPVEEALAIARQIVLALEAAHDKGIVHRDLKPANIALTANEQVKILDFGLARAIDSEDSSDPWRSPTVTFHGTEAGVILGTAAYMSPEQAKGRIADKRSDVWAFGCVFYEMLTGRPAIEGDGVSETLAAVLRGEPDWSALPPGVPPAIQTLIRRCLTKDRQQRIGDLAVAEYVLREPFGAPAGTAPEGRERAWWRRALPVSIGAGFLTIVGVAAGWAIRPLPAAPARTVTRFSIPLGLDQAFMSTVRRLVALSPDGTRLVYAANGQLYLRSMDQVEAAPVRGTDEDATEPFFSPDGQWIGYYGSRQIKKISIAGGVPTALCELAAAPLGTPFWDGNRIVYAGGSSGIFELPATGGTPRLIVNPKQGEFYHGPQVLPDGQSLLFTVGTSKAFSDRWSSAQIVTQSLNTGERRTLVDGGTDGRYLSSGHLVYSRDGVLFAAAFDPRRLELKSGATGMIEGLGPSSVGTTGTVQVAYSTTGSIAYVSTPTGQTTLAWRDRTGVDTAIATPSHDFGMPRVSPDGTRIATWAADQNSDIWIWDIRSQTLTRLTFDSGQDLFPVWTRDGRRLVYVSSRTGSLNLFSQLADGTGQAEALLPQAPASNGALVANSITPDGKSLIVSLGVPSDVMIMPLDGGRQLQPLIAHPGFAERSADVSADGRWIAYQSNEAGAFQIYVRPFPAVNEGRWQVSSDGGTLPRWTPNGRELLYVDRSNRLVSVAVKIGTAFSFGATTPVFDLTDSRVSVYRNYDPTADGSRFAIVKTIRPQSAPHVIVVENWFEELKQRVPARSIVSR